MDPGLPDAPRISVRRCVSWVFWINSMDDPDYYFFAEQKYYVFEVDKYQEIAIGGSVDDLPLLNSEELQRVFPVDDLPRSNRDVPHSCLYRLPEVGKDPYGDFMVQTFRDCLADIESLQLCPAEEPEVWQEVRVGFELPDIPEMQVHVGRHQGQLTFRFVNLPTFPLWVSSRTLDQRFGDYFRL
jgi:hypothetical protein